MTKKLRYEGRRKTRTIEQKRDEENVLSDEEEKNENKSGKVTKKVR